MKIINIKTEYIELQQLLKMEEDISSGGQAKYYLMENEVLVNRVIETRRGRKLRANNVIKIGKEGYQIASFLKLN
jgi:S4 domain protein YaaA